MPLFSLLLLLLLLSPLLAASRPDLPLYKQPGAPVDQRVEDLLARMTLVCP